MGIAALWVGAVVAGCGGDDTSRTTTSTTSEPTTTTTTEAQTPPKPGGAAATVGDGDGGVKLEQLGSFAQPVYVTQPPSGDDEHLYVVEQCGTIQRVPVGGGDPSVFLDISSLVTCGGEQGLLSVAFAPDYERSGLLYVNYTDKGGASQTVEYRRSDGNPETADPDSARRLLQIDDFATNHNGGLLMFGPDGELYLGMGDGGGAGDPERTAQDPERALGKLLRLDPDRPGDYQLAAIGLRNPWRYSFDPRTNDIWIGDVGQDTFEEIDEAALDDLGPDLNFGWSAFEGTERFNDDQEAPNARPPVLEYGRDRGCSVTGGYVVRDPQLETLLGRYLYADFCEGQLRSFTADPAKRGGDDRPVGPTIPQLSSFGTDAAGHVYAVSLDGPVYRLTPDAG
jgi:glucose/arabinose dehydrogenase